MTIELPGVSERRRVHIVNPCAGDGKYLETITANVKNTGEEMIVTREKGEAEILCRDIASQDPAVHLMIYGGDGTVHEAVNGIMTSGKADTVLFSVVSAGSGNDFSAYANRAAGFSPADIHRLDVIRTSTGRYYINGLNMGFDAQVVQAADVYKHKKGLRSGMAYIAGVVKVLVTKPVFPAEIVLEGVRDFADGKGKNGTVSASDTYLLCDCANGPFCGGGFKGAPLCDMKDGYMDVLLVKEVTRRKFISLVKDYHDGTYILPDGTMDPRFDPYLDYFQCKKITIKADTPYCLDGEVQNGGEVTAEICHQAIGYAAL
ncbi:MAG: hypothetical protein IJ325_07835 [Clostridia bacterium]|nr:hypothetical protein [Clostridia bacterium]